MAAAVAPGVVAIILPALILYGIDHVPIFSDVRELMPEAMWWLPPMSVFYIMGIHDIVRGACHVLAAMMRVHIQGRAIGPRNGPAGLDVQEIYRETRNPMSLGVFTLIHGEALFFDSLHLYRYFLVVLTVQLVRVPLYEERRLRNSFAAPVMGPQYEEYCNRVPRWLPRFRS